MSILEQSGPLALFFAFAIAHALADFPLQGEYLAKSKVRRTARDRQEWFIALTAHSLIHGGAVWLISGSPVLGAAEVVLHGLIDFGKGEEKFDLATDQVLHLTCKAGYVVALVMMG